MTSASAARNQRRENKKLALAAAERAASALGEAPKSVITLTEVPGTGSGFTIGLGLHGARMEVLNPEAEPQPVSIVDVLALAIVHTLRAQPQAFQDAVALVNSTLKNVNEQIAGGVMPEVAIAGADAALGGAIGDIETPEPANAD